MKPLRKNFVGFKYGQSFVSKVYIGGKNPSTLQFYRIPSWILRFRECLYVLRRTANGWFAAPARSSFRDCMHRWLERCSVSMRWDASTEQRRHESRVEKWAWNGSRWWRRRIWQVGKHEGRVIGSMIFMQTSHPSHDMTLMQGVFSFP